MDVPITHWEELMRHARRAFQECAYREALELNTSALLFSKRHFNQLFELDADRAIAAVLVSYFNAIDNHLALYDFIKARECFDNALSFLIAVNAKPQLSEKQKHAILHGASHLHNEWCRFLKANQNDVSDLKLSAFQASLAALSAQNHHAVILH